MLKQQSKHWFDCRWREERDFHSLIQTAKREENKFLCQLELKPTKSWEYHEMRYIQIQFHLHKHIHSFEQYM